MEISAKSLIMSVIEAELASDELRCKTPYVSLSNRAVTRKCRVSLAQTNIPA